MEKESLLETIATVLIPLVLVAIVMFFIDSIRYEDSKWSFRFEFLSYMGWVLFLSGMIILNAYYQDKGYNKAIKDVMELEEEKFKNAVAEFELTDAILQRIIQKRKSQTTNGDSDIKG